MYPETNGTRPGFWIDAGIHAREWIAPATALNMINKVSQTLYVFAKISKLSGRVPERIRKKLFTLFVEELSRFCVLEAVMRPLVPWLMRGRNIF